MKSRKRLTVLLTVIIVVAATAYIFSRVKASLDPFEQMLGQTAHGSQREKEEYETLMRIIHKMEHGNLSDAEQDLKTVTSLLGSDNHNTRGLARSALQGFARAKNREKALTIVRDMKEETLGDSVAKFTLLRAYDQPEWKAKAEDCASSSDAEWSDFCKQLLTRDAIKSQPPTNR